MEGCKMEARLIQGTPRLMQRQEIQHGFKASEWNERNHWYEKSNKTLRNMSIGNHKAT